MPNVIEDLSEEECYLWALISDKSGLDLAEFCWQEHENEWSIWRAWPYQWKWFRDESNLQIEQSARSAGKSLSIKMRAFAFPFLHPGQEMVIAAPELNHLTPIISLIEHQFKNTRLGLEMLPKGRNQGITHRPFQCDFQNGARIIGRIPQRDGRGVKGIHPLWLELDEAQDFPDAGWVELIETLKRGNDDARWRAHGVTKGVRDYFYKFTQPESGWTVHHITAMARPTWSDEERQQKIEQYGSRDHPDYRRNILGAHGDASNPLFVLHRLMLCHLGGTPVHTPHGIVPIEALEVGSIVLNAVGEGEVLASRSVQKSRVYRITTDTGEQFVVSPEHPYFTSRGWCHADNLVLGDELITRDEALRGMWGSHPEQKSEAVLWESLHREVAWADLPRFGYGQADLAELRMVRRQFLPSIETGSVLQCNLCCEMARSVSSPIGCQRVRVVQDNVRTSTKDQSFLHYVLSGTVGEFSASETPETTAGPFTQSRSWWFAGRAISSLARVGRAVATPILDESIRGIGRRMCLHDDRFSASGKSDSGRSGWPKSSLSVRQGQDSGRLVDRQRVECIEILESGDIEFDLLSGGKDTVTLYDITVSCHPSFAVGETGVLSHNCVDQGKDSPEDSEYNTEIYQRYDINAEYLEDRGGAIETLLTFPSIHLEKYKTFWAGMDVGFTNHPSEILVFAEEPQKGKENLFRLVTRINLQRIGIEEQVDAILHVMRFYRVKAFSLDKTGVGLPLFQLIQATDISLAEKVKGYGFSEKILVDLDETKDVDEYRGDVIKDSGMYRNVLEYASDELRRLVDANRLRLPWDRDLIGEFQGQTYVVVRDTLNQYGKRSYSKGNFHALDAAKMAVLGWRQETIEAFAKEEKFEPTPIIIFGEW